MGCKRREWTLDDGSVWNTENLSKLVGITSSSAYYRLNHSSDPNEVLKPKSEVKSSNGLKIYTLDDGSKWTAEEVVKHTGCKKSTVATRLTVYTDPEKVLAPPLSATTIGKTVSETIKKRMFYDPLGHWKLLNMNT